MQLKELMTTHVQGISTDQSVCEAAQATQRLGIVSVGDLVAKSGEHTLCAELIEMVSLPAEPSR